MEYDCIIIGAGIGGLLAAFCLSQEGRKVIVLEAQPVVGGYASAFTRRGFTFESSLHCVGGMGKEGDMRKFLEEQGLAQDLEFIEPKEFCRIIYPENDFILDFSSSHRADHLKEYFPSQRSNIDGFFKAVDGFVREFDAFGEMRLPQWSLPLAMPFFFRNLMRASNLTAQEFIQRYTKDEKLASVLTDFWGFAGLPPARLSALYFLLVFQSYYFGSVAQIKGGFSRLLDVVAKRIQAAGGKIQFNTKVARILTQGQGKVSGVMTVRQEEFKARAVISNANAFDTLGEFLDDGALRQKYRQKLARYEKSISGFQVYLGLKVPTRALGMTHPMCIVNPSYGHEEQFSYNLQGDYDRCPFILTDHSLLDPALVPPGKGSLLIIVLDTYSHWKGLDKEAYKAKKQSVATKFIQRAERYLPGLSGNIEVMEAASPLTMERYTGSPEGALYGFAQTLNQSGAKRLPQETAIKGLFLAGAWTFPGGGVNSCFWSGCMAAELAAKFLKASSK